MYGEALLANQRDDIADGEDTGRPQRTRTTRTNGYAGYDIDFGSEGGQSSENEWQGGDDEEEDNDFEGDDEEEASGDESVANGETPSLVVQLRYGKGRASNDSEAEQQGSGVNGNGPPDTAQDSNSQMQLDDKSTSAGQSLESQKEQSNGFNQGPHVTSVGQPATVGTETG